MNWNDPTHKAWYGVVKSSLQKHVRRGEPEEAAKMAEELWRLQPSGFMARMPIIVAEDALEGAGLMPRLGENHCGVAAEVARRPKNKDAGGMLWALYFDGRKTFLGDEWFGVGNRLDQFVHEGKALEACGLAWEMWEKKYKKEVFEILGNNKSASVFLDRADKPTVFEGEPKILVVSAVLVVAGVVKEDPNYTPIDLSKQPSMLDGDRIAPWYGCDMHTAPGKIAMSRILSRGLVKGNDKADAREMLKTLWFRCESSKFGSMVTHRWWNKEYAMEEIGLTFEQGQAMWDAIKGEVFAEVKHAARSFGIQVTGG